MHASAGLHALWRSRGVGSRLLLPLALLYGAATSLRRLLYRIGWLEIQRLPVPVIVVGNLIAGGAGKTPTVRALVRTLRAHGYRPAVVSRGYGGEASGVTEVLPSTPARQCGDEPLLLRLRADVPVFVGQDRVAAGRALLQAHRDVDVIVADDGLQHLRLYRDVQVIVFDERGAGNGWLLPAGPLREPMPEALPPRSLVLYNAPAATTPLRGTPVARGLSGIAALRDWWDGSAARPELLEALRGRPVVAAAGLAFPERFHAMLRDRGLVIETLALPDHFDWLALPWPADARDVIVTEKDAVKIDPARIGRVRVWVAALDFVPAPEFDAALLRMLPPPSSLQPDP